MSAVNISAATRRSQLPVAPSVHHPTVEPVSTVPSAVPVTTPPATSSKLLLVHWDDTTALDASTLDSLSELNLAFTKRNHNQQGPHEEKEQKSHSPQNKPRTFATSTPRSLLDEIVAHDASAASAPSTAQVTDLSLVDSSVSFPFSQQPTINDSHATTTTVPPSALTSLLLHSQLYTTTGAYVQHLQSIRPNQQVEYPFIVDHSSAPTPTFSTSTPSAHTQHLQYYLHLRSTSGCFQRLLSSTNSLLEQSNSLLQHFDAVFAKTNSVREECSALLVEQQQLAAATFKMNYHLSYFVEYESIQMKLGDEAANAPLVKFMRDFSDAQSFAASANANAGAHALSQQSQLDPLSANPMLSGDFVHILSALDHCIEYMKSNADFLDATAARVRYEKLHATILRNVRNFFRANVERAIKLGRDAPAVQAQLPAEEGKSPNEKSLGLYQTQSHWMRIFVQMRSLAQAIRPLLVEMEHRAFVNEGGIFGTNAAAAASSSSSASANAPASSPVGADQSQSTQPLYKELLFDCYRIYSEKRHSLLYAELQTYLTDLAKSGRPLSQLIRIACTSWIELCNLESQLFTAFFSVNQYSISVLNEFLHAFCSSILYTQLRPMIIHNTELDTLAEVITILKEEIMEEQVKTRGNKNAKPSSSSAASSSSSSSNDLFHTSSPLYSFSKSIQRLIADVQERLIYRAQLYIRDTIQKYQSTKDDLDYPKKLAKPAKEAATSPESAVGSAVETPAALDPTAMMASLPPLLPVAPTSSTNREHLFSTWHPCLERTLMCLSKLFRCVEPSVFRYLAQEAVSVCTAVLMDCSNKIGLAHASVDPQNSDGLLFLIKHLLILREQITPFAAVDFSITSTDLDFGHMKDVLPNIFSSVGKWSSFLELIQTSAPRLIENKQDSKKAMEQTLKTTCEQLIANQTQFLIGPLLEFFNQMGATQQSGQASHQPSQFKAKLVAIVAKMSGVQPGGTADATTESPFAKQLQALKSQTTLYLANPATERVLCKPVQRTVGEVLEQLKFFVSTHFPRDGGSSSSASAAPAGLTEDDKLTVYLEEQIARLESVLRESITE